MTDRPIRPAAGPDPIPPQDDVGFDRWLTQALREDIDPSDSDELSRAVLTRLVAPVPGLRLSTGGVLAGYGTLLSLGVLAGYLSLPLLGLSAELVGLVSVVGDGLGLLGGLQ